MTQWRGAFHKLRHQELDYMTDSNYPQLSKSRFLAGLQCLKRLYLECYQRELADPIGVGQQAISDAGTAVGELARQRFPGGALIEERYFEHSKAARSTQDLLADPSIPALYESAFSFEGVRTRVDILNRSVGHEFDLIEVKSTTSVKDIHIPDIAIQTRVVEGAGVRIRHAYLMRIDNAYVYRGGNHDPHGLFSLTDVTDRVREYISGEMSNALAGMWESLETEEAPDIETGRQCTIPYVCPFFGHCHRDESAHPIRTLPGLRQQGYERLKPAGITDIGAVPPDFAGLTALQCRARDSVVTGQPFVGSGLGARLGDILFPASFLDFETISPAIPIFPGARPYQTIPFQWSLHTRDRDGGLTHSEFLDDGSGDPRERLITGLLATLPGDGSIVAYSGYEVTVLKGLARDFPQHQGQLLELCDRVTDLLRLIRSDYYHPEFHGSFSIKSVLLALVPGLAYDDLAIPDGLAAATSYARLITGAASSSEVAGIREALLSCCERDTEAMVRVFEALLALTGAAGD